MTRERWIERTFRMRLDVGTYGSEPDDEEIAYLLRMGGIDAEVPKVDWRKKWHSFVDDGGGRCLWCHVTADRAIHSRPFAEKRGYEFVEVPS